MPETLTVETIIKLSVGLVLFGYWVIAFVMIYHLTRFGIGVQPKKFSAIFLLGSVVLSCLTIVLALQLNLNVLEFKW